MHSLSGKKELSIDTQIHLYLMLSYNAAEETTDKIVERNCSQIFSIEEHKHVPMLQILENLTNTLSKGLPNEISFDIIHFLATFLVKIHQNLPFGVA